MIVVKLEDILFYQTKNRNMSLICFHHTALRAAIFGFFRITNFWNVFMYVVADDNVEGVDKDHIK